MREASERRTVTDTDSCAFFIYKSINRQRGDDRGKFNFMTKQKAQLATIISAFINKHGTDRRMLSIDQDYEFIVDGFSNVIVTENSINILSEERIQFNGEAQVKRHDAASQIVSYCDVNFNGDAFLAQDTAGDSVLLRVSLNYLKDILL